MTALSRSADRRTGPRGLPENTSYADTGCELAPSCLKCPLHLCKYDDPEWGKAASIARRDIDIVNKHKMGMKAAKIATEVDASIRTVYRVLQRDGYGKKKPSEVVPFPAAASSPSAPDQDTASQNGNHHSPDKDPEDAQIAPYETKETAMRRVA